MMLLDGCFIIQLLRELGLNNFAESYPSQLLSKRWMLPVVRRDLITLENQLPMVVLKKLFNLQSQSEAEDDGPTLEELALRFFNPLMHRPHRILKNSIESMSTANGDECQFKHLLDLFHSSICLKKPEVKNYYTCPASQEAAKNEQGEVPRRYFSVSELKKTGIKVRDQKGSEPLELIFDKGVLRMPCLRIDDHTGSLFCNMVAYEQCHLGCQPDMTTYLFFLVKLINTAHDVEILHYEGVIQHALGSNEQVAELVNNLCREVEHDGHGSHLACRVVEGINSHANKWLVKTKARLRHDYFSDFWTGMKTFAAFLLLYLALLQATCNVIDSVAKEGQQDHQQAKSGAWGTLHLLLVDPLEGFKKLAPDQDLHLSPLDPIQGLKSIWQGNSAPKEPSNSFCMPA